MFKRFFDPATIYMRRAQRSTAAAARRRAAQEAQRAAEREEVLQRFQKLSIVFVFCAAAALVWGLVLRPIDVTVTPYTAPEIQPMPDVHLCHGNSGRG